MIHGTRPNLDVVIWVPAFEATISMHQSHDRWPFQLDALTSHLDQPLQHHLFIFKKRVHDRLPGYALQDGSRHEVTGDPRPQLGPVQPLARQLRPHDLNPLWRHRRPRPLGFKVQVEPRPTTLDVATLWMLGRRIRVDLVLIFGEVAHHPFEVRLVERLACRHPQPHGHVCAPLPGLTELSRVPRRRSVHTAFGLCALLLPHAGLGELGLDRKGFVNGKDHAHSMAGAYLLDAVIQTLQIDGWVYLCFHASMMPSDLATRAHARSMRP